MSERLAGSESNGTPDRNRTYDLQLRRLPLYPTELPGQGYDDVKSMPEGAEYLLRLRRRSLAN